MESDHFKKLRIHRLLSLLTLFIGLALVTFMIVSEGEPGALPLALILVGTGWYLFSRSKLRSQQN
ncbi:MAG: hypothetical protein CL666_14395 [Balneola sp.]|nr:hypothetical protein [Balneola sp.]|tara:strand:- start:23813 stop:24007 length:195 start_codon:yes stop_codon:yes gene_type:complete